ncbi:MAG: hypothetical protein ACMZ7B_12400 [Balneola sp.]
MNYKNKIVWITGASSGIGEAFAKAFLMKGQNSSYHPEGKKS